MEVSFTPRPLYPLGDRRPYGPQRRSRHCREENCLLLLPEIENLFTALLFLNNFDRGFRVSLTDVTAVYIYTRHWFCVNIHVTDRPPLQVEYNTKTKHAGPHWK
jgi:hypothetical protein